MGEREPRWYDEPRWYYVGNGQRRYRDGSGWTDRYEDIDGPTPTPEAELPELPEPTAVLEPAASGTGRVWSACRLLRSVTAGDRVKGVRRRIRSGVRVGSAGRPESCQPDGSALLSPEWQAALRVGAAHPALPDVRFTTRGTRTLEES